MAGKMTERGAIGAILRSFVDILRRRDESRATFEAQFLREFGETRRKVEASHEILKEIQGFISDLVKRQGEIREDFDQHVKDRTKHAA